jgi:hypothetical protein
MMKNEQTRPDQVPLPIVQQVKVDISLLTDRMSKTADRNEVEALRKRIIMSLK